MKFRVLVSLLALSFASASHNVTAAAPVAAVASVTSSAGQVSYHTLTVDKLPIFYREAGDPKLPTLVLLHGFPTSSNMYRELIPLLAKQFHIIAPDYPGSGQSVIPADVEFNATFDKLSAIMNRFLEQKGLSKYALYVQDFGGPVGMRIAASHPERVTALIIQNANAYQEGLSEKLAGAVKKLSVGINPDTDGVLEHILSPQSVQSMYTVGMRSATNLDPSTWTLDSAILQDVKNKNVQKELLVDYHSNLNLYPQWQTYLRTHQPPTLVVWGKNDPYFVEAGAHAYRKDLKNAEVHILNTGHFALEEDSVAIAGYISKFAKRNKLVK